MNEFQPLPLELSARICVTLLHSVWQVAVLAALAWLAGRFWCKRSVEWAYTVNVWALMLGLACVPVTYMLSGHPQKSDVAAVTYVQPSAVTGEQPTESPANLSLVAPNGTVAVTTKPQSVGAVAEAPAEEVKVGGGVSWATVWSWTSPWLVGLYAVGVVLMLLRLAVEIIRAERFRGRSQPLSDGPLFDGLRRLADAWVMRLVPALATTEHIVVPRVVGLVKPTILIPAATISGLSPCQLEMILAHELAHVRRYDLWINLVQRLAEAALFFNPPLWLLSRRISSLREYCCDELACGGAQEPSDASHLLYAQALLQVGELSNANSRIQSDLTVLAASGRSPSELRRRVARLFGEPVRESLQLSRGVLIPLSLVVAMIVAQLVRNTLAESDFPPEDGVATALSSGEKETIQPGLSGDSIDATATAISDPASSIADLAVAEARSRTFGLNAVARIAFKQTYHMTGGFDIPEGAKEVLTSLWNARARQVADAEFDRNRQTLLAWDGDRLLLESFYGSQPDLSSRQAHYWDGQQGWKGDTIVNKQGESKYLYRYGTLDKLTEHTMPFDYPQWAAAGDRLPWPGPRVALREHKIDPRLTHYQLAGTDTIDGVLCDVYDGHERHEKVWVERATKLVKAVSRHYVSGLSREESWNVISEAAGRTFDDQQAYDRWLENLSAKQKEAYLARWSAATWKFTRPGNLAVFFDYREIASGVQWPHKVDRVVVHPNDRGDGGLVYYLTKIVVEQIQDFEIDDLAAAALPKPGVKVTDLTGAAPFEYVWTDELNQAEVERLRDEKLAEKRAELEKTRRINATPIESVDDAIRILTEGPNTESTALWARAIQYLSDHPVPALPKLIEAIDGEDRDHPISKLAFALRAIGDARAVPALIRALPRTLQPSRSDYGLLLDDVDLRRFMQQHDNSQQDGGHGFTYNRAFGEVVGALRRLTGHQLNEMELNWVHLQGTDLQRRLARQQFEQVAHGWSNWWEGNWQTYVNDTAFSNVNLPEPFRPNRRPIVARKPPSGPGVALISVASGGTIQSVHETGKACFIDLDTKREAGWPNELPALGKTRLESPELRDWARREGFDLVGITYQPTGETKPLYCLMPLDLRAWKITEDEHRSLPEIVRGQRPYPLTRPVDLLIPRRTIPERRDREHSGDSFLFVTREGTAGVLRLTAQITEARDITGGIMTEDHLFESVGFNRGVKYVLSTMSVPAVSDAAGSEPATGGER